MKRKMHRRDRAKSRDLLDPRHAKRQGERERESKANLISDLERGTRTRDGRTDSSTWKQIIILAIIVINV